MRSGSVKICINILAVPLEIKIVPVEKRACEVIHIVLHLVQHLNAFT